MSDDSTVETGQVKSKRGGRRPGAGRKPKAQKAANVSITEMVEQALTLEGGIEYLRKQARLNPRAFLALVGKRVVQKTEVSGPAGGAITVILSPV